MWTKKEEILSDWHFVLLVLFAGISPFAHLSSEHISSPAQISISCSENLSRSYHPLVGSVIKCLYQLLGTKDESCRAVNLQLHAANSILLYVVINQLLSSQRLYDKFMRQQTSALCAIFFAVHPARADITALSLSINESLSLSLCLAGLLCLLPVFANKVIAIFAPATICFFTLGAIVKSDAADVPLVIAFLLAFRALKIPAKAGRRLIVGVCLTLPMLIILIVKTLDSSRFDSMHSNSKSKDLTINFSKKDNMTNSKSSHPISKTDNSGDGFGAVSTTRSAFLHVCIGISEVICRQIYAFTTKLSPANGLDTPWNRDIHMLSTSAIACLGFYIILLAVSVFHIIYQVAVGKRANILAVIFIAFSILCVRGEFETTGWQGRCTSVGQRTYLPASFISIFISFALVDAWAFSSSGVEKHTKGATRAPISSMPLLAKCGYIVLIITSLLYIIHQLMHH